MRNYQTSRDGATTSPQWTNRSYRCCGVSKRPNAEPNARIEGGARVYDILPDGVDPKARAVILDIHGGGLILCGGEIYRIMGINAANRFGHRVWSVDYRMPPDHPGAVVLHQGLVDQNRIGTLGKGRISEGLWVPPFGQGLLTSTGRTGIGNCSRSPGLFAMKSCSNFSPR